MSRIQTTSLLFFFDIALTGEALTNAARYDIWLTKYASEILTTPATDEPPVDWANKVKAKYIDPIVALNPDVEIGLYVEGGAAMGRQWDPVYAFTSDAQAFHKPGGAVLVTDPGDLRHRWPNYISDGVKTDHVGQYMAFMALYGIKHLFFDSWLPSFYATQIASVQFTFPGGIQEGPLHLTSTWINLLPQFTVLLRDALEAAGGQLYVNGIHPSAGLGATAEDVFMGQYNANLADYATGVMFEHWHTCYGVDAATFATYLATVDAAQAKGAAVYVAALAWLFTQTHPSAPPATYGTTMVLPDADVLARYYLAAYLLIADARSSYGHQPFMHIAYFGFDAGVSRVYWSDDFDIDFGDAAGPYYVDGLLTIRVYSRGIVAVNPAATGATFTHPGTWRVWGEGPRITIGPGDADDTTVTGIAMPGRSGYWFERSTAA